MPDYVMLLLQLETQISVYFYFNFNFVVLSSITPFHRNNTINSKSTICGKLTFIYNYNISIFTWEYLGINHNSDCLIFLSVCPQQDFIGNKGIYIWRKSNYAWMFCSTRNRIQWFLQIYLFLKKSAHFLRIFPTVKESTCWSSEKLVTWQ